MAEPALESPIYDALVEKRGDAVADARTASDEAHRQVEEALHNLRTTASARSSGRLG